MYRRQGDPHLNVLSQVSQGIFVQRAGEMLADSALIRQCHFCHRSNTSVPKVVDGLVHGSVHAVVQILVQKEERLPRSAGNVQRTLLEITR